MEAISGRYFEEWSPHFSALWSRMPVRLQHRLHQSSLFSNESLFEIIERHPREHYSVIHMGDPRQSRRFWREGDLGGMRGCDVVKAIEHGRLWLNLRQLNKVDHRFQEVLDGLFEELQHHMPSFKTWNRNCGVLISSPGAQVYYHCDLPGQALFQISGRKRIFFYPAAKPFLAQEDLEHIAIFGVEVDLPYEKYFDSYAYAYDLEPGQMFSWPLNAPHRIENYDTLNISLTAEYLTDDIRRANALTRGNGVLRHRLGLTPKSYAKTGPAFWGKLIMQRVLRDTKWMERAKAGRRDVDFVLDPNSPGAIIDLPADEPSNRPQSNPRNVAAL